MRNNVAKKKTKFKFKYLFTSLVVLIMVLSVTLFSYNAKAVTGINAKFDVYNLCFSVGSQVDSEYFICNCAYSFSTDNSKFLKYNGVQYIHFASGVSGFSLQSDYLYFGYGFLNNSGEVVEIDNPYGCIKVTDYIAKISDTSNDMGYYTGYQVAQDYYLNELAIQKLQYETTYNDLLNSLQNDYYSIDYVRNNYTSNVVVNGMYVPITRYESLQNQYDQLLADYNSLNNQNIPLSFKTLLATIFYFPLNLFSGLRNVELFGVNIYYLIIGLAFLSITLPLIFFLLRKLR